MLKVYFFLGIYFFVGVITALIYQLLTHWSGLEFLLVMFSSPIALVGLWALWSEKYRVCFFLTLIFFILPIFSYWLNVLKISDSLGILTKIYDFRNFAVPALALLFLSIHKFQSEFSVGYPAQRIHQDSYCEDLD